jgi:hypothetical protein
MDLARDVLCNGLGKSVIVFVVICIAATVSPFWAAAVALVFALVCQQTDFADMHAETVSEFVRRDAIAIQDAVLAATASLGDFAPIFAREPVFRYDIPTAPEQDYPSAPAFGDMAAPFSP